MTENQKKGRYLVTHKWLDKNSKIWKFEFGYKTTITSYVDGKPLINSETIIHVSEMGKLLIDSGYIYLGQIFESNIVEVNYKNDEFILKQI
ncbi:hypothetical protein [Draconibacterium sediminis]|uniref:Uncharacterized protein n=1 Tax=Draconibacterium sediminis TaxID=1544798 RepID=A0A0D8J8M7_9BACT|nr:hypothetical protein [Draconibacterium sediminis]KJF42851.1 hypothetical protein LH29_15645 [Draconibacterium sediminis]